LANIYDLAIIIGIWNKIGQEGKKARGQKESAKSLRKEKRQKGAGHNYTGEDGRLIFIYNDLILKHFLLIS